MNRFFVPLLLLIALVARMAVPAGFMPGADANGMVALTICKGADIATIFVPADEAPAQDHQLPQNDCAFSVTMAADASAKKPVSVFVLSSAWLEISNASEHKLSFVRIDHNDASPRAPPAIFIA